MTRIVKHADLSAISYHLEDLTDGYLATLSMSELTFVAATLLEIGEALTCQKKTDDPIYGAAFDEWETVQGAIERVAAASDDVEISSPLDVLRRLSISEIHGRAFGANDEANGLLIYDALDFVNPDLRRDMENEHNRMMIEMIERDQEIQNGPR